jgi:hypothetical protein
MRMISNVTKKRTFAKTQSMAYQLKLKTTGQLSVREVQDSQSTKVILSESKMNIIIRGPLLSGMVNRSQCSVIQSLILDLNLISLSPMIDYMHIGI